MGLSRITRLGGYHGSYAYDSDVMAWIPNQNTGLLSKTRPLLSITPGSEPVRASAQ